MTARWVVTWVGCCGLAAVGCKKDIATPDSGTDAGMVEAATDAGSAEVGVVAASRVAVKESPKDKARSVALVQYGERVDVLETQESYLLVRLSDGTQGFLPTRHVVVGNPVAATLVAEQDLYARPDALSPVKRREKRGVLLFILSDKNGWRQVHLPDRTEGWVPRDKVSTAADEVALAVALHRAALVYADHHEDRALGMLREALGARPGAALASVVEARLAEWVPDAGAVAPPASGESAAPPSSAAADAPATQPTEPEEQPAPSGAGSSSAPLP